MPLFLSTYCNWMHCNTIYVTFALTVCKCSTKSLCTIAPGLTEWCVWKHSTHCDCKHLTHVHFDLSLTSFFWLKKELTSHWLHETEHRRCDAMAPAVGDGLRGVAPVASGTQRHRRRGRQRQGRAIADKSIETTSCSNIQSYSIRSHSLKGPKGESSVNVESTQVSLLTYFVSSPKIHLSNAVKCQSMSTGSDCHARHVTIASVIANILGWSGWSEWGHSVLCNCKQYHRHP